MGCACMRAMEEQLHTDVCSELQLHNSWCLLQLPWSLCIGRCDVKHHPALSSACCRVVSTPRGSSHKASKLAQSISMQRRASAGYPLHCRR